MTLFTPAGQHTGVPGRLLLSLLLTGLFVLAGCKEKQAGPAPAPTPVTVAAPVQQSVRNYQTFDGTVAPLLQVNLEARVPGYLDKVLFNDGAQVKKDDLLFVIEQDQYQQQLNLAQAIYTQAKIEFDRQTTMMNQRATSQAALDKARSDLQQAEANLALAKINLGYTEIRAPFDGVMGRHLIDAGNYLSAGPSGVKLATIRQISPLYVYFSMNEMELLRFLRSVGGMQAGERFVGSLPVYAALQGDTDFPHAGVLDFAASDLSTATGNLQLRARFPNTDKRMVPGMYAKVLVMVGEPRQALLVPFDAVMRDQQGDYVFVVGADNKAQRRQVGTGFRFGPLVEVSSGLQAQDKVVVNGFVTLSAGHAVQVQEGTIAPAKLPGLPG